MPKGMSKLKHLHFLSNYIVGKHEENKIGELGALKNLHGSLDISKLENVINGDEALEARIADRKHIKSLALRWTWDNNIDDSQIERDILDKLQPHPNLEKLSVNGYRGTAFPDWLGYSCYKNMNHLTLGGCKNCCMLPALGQLPSLKHLEISSFESLVSIGAEFYKSDESCRETPFPSLETLKFLRLHCLKEWRSFEFDGAFPQLKELTLEGCPLLIGDLPSHLPALEKLTIGKSECNNELRMQELPLSLRSLSISGNQLVESVFEAMTPIQLTCLQSLRIGHCDSAISFPVDCFPLSLQSLEIRDCKKLHFPMQQQPQHESLQNLSIHSSCDSLTSFSLNVFPNLRYLNIWNCENMKYLVASQSDNVAISSLRSLSIYSCPNLESFSTLWVAAPQLQSLHINSCPELDSFPERVLSPNLRELEVRGCEKLVSFLASMDLRSHGLTRLVIQNASETVTSFPEEDGHLPASLKSLSCWNFPSLETLDCSRLSHLTSLQYLQFGFCDKLDNITGERLPASLKSLNIRCSPLGERIKVKDPQIWPKISHIGKIEVTE